MKAPRITIGLVTPRVLARYAHAPNFAELATLQLARPLRVDRGRCRQRRVAAASRLAFDCICTCGRCDAECVAEKTERGS